MNVCPGFMTPTALFSVRREEEEEENEEEEELTGVVWDVGDGVEEPVMGVKL